MQTSPPSELNWSHQFSAISATRRQQIHRNLHLHRTVIWQRSHGEEGSLSYQDKVRATEKVFCAPTDSRFSLYCRFEENQQMVAMHVSQQPNCSSWRVSVASFHNYAGIMHLDGVHEALAKANEDNRIVCRNAKTQQRGQSHCFQEFQFQDSADTRRSSSYGNPILTLASIDCIVLFSSSLRQIFFMNNLGSRMEKWQQHRLK